MRGPLVPVLAVALALAAPAGGASGPIRIEHEPIACALAGRYLRVLACLRPRAEVIGGRVLFRARGDTAWSFVDLDSEMPCYVTALPRFRTSDGPVAYAIEARGRGAAVSRTGVRSFAVVDSPAACPAGTRPARSLGKAKVAVKTLPESPGLATPATVPAAPSSRPPVREASRPASPPGSAPARSSASSRGGSSARWVVLGVVGAGAAAGGFALGRPKGGSGAPSSTTTTMPAAVTTTLPPPSTVPGVDQPPVIVASIDPDPPSGPAPLTVTIDICRSYDPEGKPVQFLGIGFGEGQPQRGVCHATHTYDAPPGSSFRARAGVSDGVNQTGIEWTITITPAPGLGSRAEAVRLSSELDAPGATAEIMVDGALISVDRGRRQALLDPRGALVRLDGVLTTARGPGLWRLDLVGAAPQSLQVLAGDPVSLASTSVTFRLAGVPGERIAVRFRAARLPEK